jgi:hypothetical protein
MYVDAVGVNSAAKVRDIGFAKIRLKGEAELFDKRGVIVGR